MDYRSENIYPALRNKGFNGVNLSATQATFDAVRDALADPSVVFITGSGHGTDTTFTGYSDLPIFEAASPYPGDVSGKIAHFLSCGSASLLGHDFINQGGAAFFGYDANFSFDPQASDILFNCDGEIDRALADGCTASEAMQRAATLFLQQIATPGLDSRIVAYLQTNLAHLKSPASTPAGRWGDPNAKL